MQRSRATVAFAIVFTAAVACGCAAINGSTPAPVSAPAAAPSPSAPAKGPESAGSFLCPARHATVSESAMSCSEANRAAAASIKRLGFRIVEFSAAAAGQPGSLRAVQITQSSQEYTAWVTITCSAEGAEIDAVTDFGCGGQLTFPMRFRESFAASVARKVRRPSLVPKEKRTGLQIAVEPQRHGDEELGVDLSPAGLMPVRVTILNRTNRTYVLEPNEIVLTSERGERVRGLPATKTAERLARSLPGDSAALAKRLQERGLRRHVIEPDATVRGYLYVPRQAYRRARVMLTDQATEEAEGFAIGF